MLLLVLADLALLVAAFASVYLALAWGEMGSFPLHGDKSGLGGLMAVLLFMPMRWCPLLFALGIAVMRDGFTELLPPRRGLQFGLLLGGHLLLGAASYAAFSWVSNSLQHDDPGPRRLAWTFGLLLPLPAFLVAFWGLHRAWIPRHPLLACLLVVLLGWGHLAGYRQGVGSRPAPAATP